MAVLRTEEALTRWPRPPTSLGSFISTAERARLPDDCTVGYIVEGLLGARLLPSSLFHSHLEDLRRLPPDAVLRQVRPVPGLAPRLPPTGTWPSPPPISGRSPGLREAFPAPPRTCC